MTTVISRPRGLVTHLIHLTGAEPLTARMLMDSSGKTARERLGIRPVTKRTRTRTTARFGRHDVITLPGTTEGETITKRVRRRHPVRVYRYTRDQAIAIIAEMKPRKAEYKALKEIALARAAEQEKAKGLNMRHLPRHRRWSKRRNKR
jgi:hypothetical protein